MRQYFVIALFLLPLMAWAQDNGLNPIYSLEIQDATYEVQAKKKVTAGQVLSTIANAAAGVSTDTHHEDKVSAMNDVIKSAFKYVRRLHLVDALMDGENGYLVTGHINNLTTTSKTEVHTSKDSKGKEIKKTTVRYDAVAEISLTLKEVLSGSVTTQNFRCTAYSDGPTATAEKAIAAAVNGMKGKIASYYNAKFPTRANIVERGAEKKDKQKELYIDVGSTVRTYEGQHFYIYVVGTVAGRETKKEVGRVKVSEVLGEDISLCKVQKGGKDIKVALDEGKQVVAISAD